MTQKTGHRQKQSFLQKQNTRYSGGKRTAIEIKTVMKVIMIAMMMMKMIVIIVMIIIMTMTIIMIMIALKGANRDFYNLLTAPQTATRTLKWPGRNRVHHNERVTLATCPVPRGRRGQLSY